MTVEYAEGTKDEEEKCLIINDVNTSFRHHTQH